MHTDIHGENDRIDISPEFSFDHMLQYVSPSHLFRVEVHSYTDFKPSSGSPNSQLHLLSNFQATRMTIRWSSLRGSPRVSGNSKGHGSRSFSVDRLLCDHAMDCVISFITFLSARYRNTRMPHLRLDVNSLIQCPFDMKSGRTTFDRLYLRVDP